MKITAVRALAIRPSMEQTDLHTTWVDPSTPNRFSPSSEPRTELWQLFCGLGGPGLSALTFLTKGAGCQWDKP